MTKKAGVQSQETRKRLMEAAETEFAESGFLHSSLRRICASAGVTTGALYFFFRDKEDIFRSVIESVTVPFMEIIRSHYDAEDSGRDGEDGDLEATLLTMDLYFSKRKAFRVLLMHRDAAPVKDFFEEFTSCSVEHYEKILAGLAEPPEDFAVWQFVHMQLDLMLTIAGEDFPREELVKHAAQATKMLRGAFRALIGE